jgi:hypothetical protein
MLEEEHPRTLHPKSFPQAAHPPKHGKDRMDPLENGLILVPSH